jgi:hypothetical protein
MTVKKARERFESSLLSIKYDSVSSQKLHNLLRTELDVTASYIFPKLDGKNIVKYKRLDLINTINEYLYDRGIYWNDNVSKYLEKTFKWDKDIQI